MFELMSDRYNIVIIIIIIVIIIIIISILPLKVK